MFARAREAVARHNRAETLPDQTTTSCCIGFTLFGKKFPPDSECYLPAEKCTDMLGNEFAAAPVRMSLAQPMDVFRSEEPPPSYSPPRGNMDAIEEEALEEDASEDLVSVLDSTIRTEDIAPAAPPVEIKYTEQELIVQQMWANQRQCTSMQPNRPFLQRIQDVLITDLSIGTTYRRGRLLGKGGFARCYELIDDKIDRVYAGKIISKTRLCKPGQKAKTLRTSRYDSDESQQIL